MKHNNLNNTKNVEYIDIKYKPEGQISKSDFELLKNSKEGDFNNLKQLIKDKEFQGSMLNLALRNVIEGYKPEKAQYIECLKLLLSTSIDLNYKYQKENNMTILMQVLKKFYFILIKEFLENLFIKKNLSNNNNLSNEEREELKEKNIFFSQKDSDNNNFFFYLSYNYFNTVEFFNILEYIYDIYPYHNNPKETAKKIQQIFKNLLVEKNNDGNTFMNICLFKGLTNIVLKLISITGYIPNVNKQKNNYIHCAVLGKNISCLKILLYYCSIDDLNMKNSDTLTPAQLAYKLGYITMSNVIIEYQNNFNEEEYKDHFYSSMELYKKKILNLPNNLLINFKNHKYKQLLYELKELKIINNISKDDLNSNNNNIEKEEEFSFKITYLKLEWNIILIQIKINQNDSEKDIDNNNNKNINNNKIAKKKIKKIEDKYQNAIISFYKSILELFENSFSNKFILSYIEYINYIKNNNNIQESLINYNIMEKSIDILIYNKIIFYFKFGYTKSLIDTAKIYITKIFKNNNDITIHKNSFILFVNISCILAETFISQGYHNFAEIIISSLDKYLYTNYQNNYNIEYTEEEITIFNYLNKIEVFNQYSAYFSEILCYSNFLKLLITKDKIKDIFTNTHRLLEDGKFSKDAYIFNRLYILFICMEIKRLYEKEDNKIYNKISELKNYGENSEIYYYNMIGIMYLKNQRYHLSKFFFKKAFYKYIQIIKNKNMQNDNKEKIINFRIDYITSFLYNICLCYFYLKDYNKCIIILEQLLLFKTNQKNFFIHYRLGLCYFQLYINENKKNIDYYNENILKLIGYEKIKNKNNKNEKSLSIDLENNDNNENQYEIKHKNNINKGQFNNKFSFQNNNKENFKKNKTNEINNVINNTFIDNSKYNNSVIKRIILKNSTKLINNNNNNISKKNNMNINLNYIKNKNNINNNEQNINNNTNINYLDKAIKSFKKVILITKMNTYTDSMKSLYNFYSSYVIDEMGRKNSDTSQNFHKKKKIPNELLINNYLNLLLCLSVKKNWLEMIFIIKDYNNRKIFSNKVILMKILLYKLEAYINLKNTQKIKEIINKLKGYKKIDLCLFNKANNDIINEVNIKYYLYYTLTIIYIKEKNYKEMDINVNKILFLLKEEKDVPYYIIDLLINVYLIKLNNEPNLNEKNKFKYNNIILNLIKNKKTNTED